jgi:hypothetical protein
MATQVGSPVGLGIVGGLNDERKAMDNALASFISVPNLAVPAGSIANRLPPTFGAVQPTEIRVYVGDKEITDIVKVEVGRKADQLADTVTRGKRAVV